MLETIEQSKLAQEARARGERREILVGDSKTVYWFYPAEFGADDKSALVMIHGYRGNHHGLEAIAGALRNSDVYIPDLPGFGSSQPLKAAHAIADYATWLNGFIEALELTRKPHLLGHSFGSIVVSAYAAEFDGIESLILENPVSSPALGGPRAAATAATRSFFWLAKVLPETLGVGLLKSWPMVRGMSIVMTKSRDKQLRRWIHEQHDQNFNDFFSRTVALQAYAASISHCVGDFSSAFKRPVLMLIGQRDDITSVSEQNRLFESLTVSGSKLVEFDSVGHLTHYEVPRGIAEAIELWMDARDD